MKFVWKFPAMGKLTNIIVFMNEGCYLMVVSLESLIESNNSVI
jgi:hypothetical protein